MLPVFPALPRIRNYTAHTPLTSVLLACAYRVSSGRRARFVKKEAAVTRLVLRRGTGRFYFRGIHRCPSKEAVSPIRPL